MTTAPFNGLQNSLDNGFGLNSNLDKLNNSINQYGLAPKPFFGPVYPGEYDQNTASTGGTNNNAKSYLNAFADNSANTANLNNPLLRPNDKTIQGSDRIYHLTDPADRDAYYKDAVSAAQNSANYQKGLLGQDYTRNVGAAQRSWNDQGASLNDALNNENQQEADFGRNYNTQVTDFGNNYKTGIAARENAFGRTDGYQSAQGDSEGLAQQAFNTGISNLSANKASTENGFATNRASLERNQNSLASNYQDYLGGLQRDVNDKSASLDHYVADQKANLATQISPLNDYQGLKGYDYKLDAYNPSQVNNVDLSKYGAATSFNALPSQQGVPNPGVASTLPTGTGNGPAVNGFKLPAPVTDPVSQYLDYNKTLQTPDTVKSYLYQ